MYIVQASPLTKIFLPEWHDACLSNPEIIVKESNSNSLLLSVMFVTSISVPSSQLPLVIVIVGYKYAL